MESVGQSNNLKLYNNIINSKKATPDEIGDFDTFNTLLKDSANVEKLYNNLIKLGRFSQDELGTKDEFFANIDPIQPVQPLQDAGVQRMISSAQPEREKGFWNTWAGDAIEKLGEGTAWLGEGIGRFANMPAKIFAGAIADNEGLAPGAKQAFSKLLVASSPMAGDIEMSADALKQVQKGLAEKSDRYQGKDFSQLWKEGNKTGAIGQIMLEATRSLPISITAGLTGGAGLGLIGGVSAGQKYEELSDSKQPGEKATTKEWDDYKSRMNMSELAKVSNAILSGASEAGSEFLGSVPVVSWLGRIYQKAGKNGVQDVVKNGVKTTVEKLFDKYGILAAPVVEGIEEYSNQVAQNTVDYITGSRTDFKPFENADKAFVYGAGGGAQFSAAAIPGVIANQFTGRQGNQSPVTENQVPQPDPDQQRNAMIEQMRYRMQNIAHESGELVTVMDDFGNTLFVKSGDLDDPSGLVQVVDKTGQPAGNNGFMHVSKIREHAHMPLEQALQERIPIIDKIIRDSKLPKVGAQISYQNKPFTITQDLGESFILQNEKEEPVEVLKDEFLSKEEIPEQASVPNPIVSVPFGKQSYDFTKNDDGSFNFVPSEKMPPEKALTQLQKEFENNPDWEVTTEKEEQEVPAANIFQRPTKQTVIKNISVRPKNIQNATQAPGGDNNMSGNEVRPDMQEQVEADTAPAYQFNGKDVSKDYVQGVIEDAQSKDDLVGLTYRNDPDIDAMIEKKFPAPKTIYRIGKKEVPRDRALARIDRAKNREQLEELKIENDPEMQQTYNSKLAEFQKQADQVQAENNRKHDKLVGMMQSYNQSSPTERRRINTAPMMQLASELGYNVKYENGSGVRIFKNGTEIRRNTDRLGNEEIQSHRLLSEYDEPVQKLAGSLMLPANIEGVEVGTMQPREISQAILDVQAGKKTVLSNQLLDEIEKIHSSGVVRLKGDRNTGYPGMEIPLEDFVSLINGEGTDKEREMASMIPENIVESINSQITEEDLDRYSKLIPIIYGNEQEQSTATERTDTGTVESLPESEELRQDENAEREVQKEVEAGNFSEKENQKLTETEEQYTGKQNIENIQQAESLPKNDISGEKLNKEPGQIQQPGQQTEDAQEETEGKRKQKDLEVKTPLEKALEKAEVRTKVKDEERRVNTSPTEGQKEAGNYQKGHVKIQGFDISIENPKGSMRSGTDPSGKKWKQKLSNSYGYFRRTEGYDGDQIDVFLGSNPASEKVFVVDQNKPGTDEFDESKVMMAFDNAEQAKDAYMSNYESGWTGFGAITEVPVEQFRKWLYDGAKQRKPFSEYKDTPNPIKEPWQMAKVEWESKLKDAVGTNPDNENFDDVKRLSYYIADGEGTGENNFATHEDVIKKALSEGKPVPQNVLNDYPNLKADQPGVESETKPSETAASEISEMSTSDIEKEVDSFEAIIKEREANILKSNTPLTGSNSGIGTLTEKEFDRFTALTSELQSRTSISSDEARERVKEKRAARLKGKDIRFRNVSIPETITIDGKEHPTRNSKGQFIHPTIEGIQNFWKWFGDSKVVDEQGRPLVVYHGTGSRFEEFIPGKRGIWLTPDKNRASDYAKSRMGGEEGIVMPLYAKIENPADAETDDSYTPYHELGFDGWISRRPNGEPFTIVVKNPSQIKSATGNQGTFDESNPDIRFRNVPPIGFYSTVENALDQISQDNGTPLFTTKEGGVRFATIDGLLKSNDLKKYFYKLFANAKNSGTIHVVENYNEVPEGFREKAKENKAFGFYDPNTGESYFITGRIGSADQAFKTWVHEVGAHKGLSNIIPEHQLNPLFEKIVDDLGEEEINKVLPEEYRDLGKAERGEEYLAYLAEKVITEKDLKPVEKTIWQKILDRVKDILNKVFNTKEPFTVKDAEDIIRAAVQSVYQAPQSIVDLNNIEALNDQFNTELQHQINGTLRKGHTYQLGFPSIILQDAGMPNLPIQLSSKRLEEKSSETYGHPYDISEIKDLPKVIAAPLAVFSYGDKTKAVNLITEIESNSKKFLVGISINPIIGGRKLEINSIRNVFPKDTHEWANWIVQGKGLYYNKEKVLSFLNQQLDTPTDLDLQKNSKPSSEEVSKQRYNSAEVRNLFRRATKIIEGFENNNIRFRKSDPEKPKTLHGLLMTPAGERYREGIKEKRNWKQTLQGFRDYIQEKDMPIRRWQDEMVKIGAKVKENADPFRDKKLAPGRLQTLSKEFETKMEPVLKTIARIVKAGVSIEWMEPYLIAKHTPEVNAKIRAQKLEEFKNRNFNLTRWIEKNDPTEVELQEKIAELRQKELYPSEDEIAEMEESLADVDFAGILPLNKDREGNILDERFKNDPDGFANALVKDFEGMVDKELIDELWSNLKIATDAILDAQVASRMITQKQADGYRSMYKNYVPLRGWREDAAKYYTYTKGKPGQGPSVKHAEGRKSLAESPLSYIFKLGHKSLAEQVENEVRESLLRFIANNYKPEFREMYKVKSAYFVKDGIDPDTQEDVWRITFDRPSKEQFESGNAVSEFYYDHMKLRTYQHALEHEVVVHTKDGDVVVVFDRRYPDSLPVAQAFNNQNVMFNLPGGDPENATILNMIAQHKIPALKIKGHRLTPSMSLREFTNWMKSMFTQFNLKFPVTNFPRDFQESSIDSYILFGHGIPLKQNKRAYLAIDRYLRGKEIGELGPEVNNFYENGGTTGYTHELTPQEYERKIGKEVNHLLNDGKINLTRKAISDWLTRYNQRFEDSVRFAVYLNARAEGLGIKDACYRSRNATVDFNIRGKGSPWLGTVWGFFEVAVNSLAKNTDYFVRMGKTARKRAIQTAVAYTIVGFMEAMLNDWAYGDDDDDDEDNYYNRSRWMRHNYLNIPLPGETKLYVPIALSQFWRGFKGMGAMFYDYFIGQRGKLGIGEALGGIGLNFIDALFPVPVTNIYQNGEFHPGAPFVPLILKPWYEIEQNRNFMGQQIYKKPFTTKQEQDIADSSLYKDNVNTAYKFFTDLLARTTWKDNDSKYYLNKKGERKKIEGIAGILDLNPSKIEHVVSGYLGGTGDFVSDIITTAGQLINPDEDFDFKNAPFLNAFIRKTPEAKWNIIREYNQLKDYIEGMDTQESNYMKMAETGDKQALDKLKSLKLNNYDQSYAVLLEFYDNQISELSKYVDYLTGDGTDPVIEKMKEAIDQINELKFKNKKQ
jgi:hypothetical protein